MATEVTLTDRVVRVTAQGQVQALYQALDVSKFDQADLQLVLAGYDPSLTSLVVSIITGMSTESEEGWSEIAAFQSLSASLTLDKQNFPRLLRFVRWKVKTLSGGTWASFTIRGMARDN